MSSGEDSGQHGPNEPEFLEIALRAYVPTGRKPNRWRAHDPGPSEWTLIFDTETTTDAAQSPEIRGLPGSEGAGIVGSRIFHKSGNSNRSGNSSNSGLFCENQLSMHDGRRIRRKCIFPNWL